MSNLVWNIPKNIVALGSSRKIISNRWPPRNVQLGHSKHRHRRRRCISWDPVFTIGGRDVPWQRSLLSISAYGLLCERGMKTPFDIVTLAVRAYRIVQWTETRKSAIESAGQWDSSKTILAHCVYVSNMDLMETTFRRFLKCLNDSDCYFLHSLNSLHDSGREWERYLFLSV